MTWIFYYYRFLDYGTQHKMLTSKLLGGLMVLLVLGVTMFPLTNIVNAQTASNSVNVSTKGIISDSSNFHGVVIWTIINGDKGTIILQSPVGRAMVHVSIAPSTNCDTSLPICLLSTVADAGNNGILNVGDTSRLSFDIGAKKETISLLSGALAGFDVTVNLSQTWNKAPASTTTTNSTGIANPASVYCVNHGGKLDIQTTSSGQTGICTFPDGSKCEEWSYLRGQCSPAASGSQNSTSAPRHLTLSLNESVGIAVKG
jgi:putative hemolysin